MKIPDVVIHEPQRKPEPTKPRAGLMVIESLRPEPPEMGLALHLAMVWVKCNYGVLPGKRGKAALQAQARKLVGNDPKWLAQAREGIANGTMKPRPVQDRVEISSAPVPRPREKVKAPEMMTREQALHKLRRTR